MLCHTASPLPAAHFTPAHPPLHPAPPFQFFKLYTELLRSDNYVTRRQSLKLLGELLLDRSNVKIMMQVWFAAGAVRAACSARACLARIVSGTGVLAAAASRIMMQVWHHAGRRLAWNCHCSRRRCCRRCAAAAAAAGCPYCAAAGCCAAAAAAGPQHRRPRIDRAASSRLCCAVQYVADVDNLCLMMNLLKDPSRSIQFEAFHVFKVGAAGGGGWRAWVARLASCLHRGWARGGVGGGSGVHVGNGACDSAVNCGVIGRCLHALSWRVCTSRVSRRRRIAEACGWRCRGRRVVPCSPTRRAPPAALTHCVPAPPGRQVFVANPNKTRAVVEILYNNRDKLLKYLDDFHNDRGERGVGAGPFALIGALCVLRAGQLVWRATTATA